MIEEVKLGENGSSFAQSQFTQSLNHPITRSPDSCLASPGLALERFWFADESVGGRPELRCVWKIVPKPVCVLRIPIRDSGFGAKQSGLGARDSGFGKEVSLMDSRRRRNEGMGRCKFRTPNPENRIPNPEPRIPSPEKERWRMDDMSPEENRESIRWRVRRARCWLQAMLAHFDDLAAALLAGVILRRSGLVACHARKTVVRG
jgi:hypothetical protein